MRNKTTSSQDDTFDRFVSRLTSELQLDPHIYERDTRLIEDLGLDSLRMLEVVTVMAQMDAEIPEGAMPFIHTLGDLHDQYATRTQSESSPSGTIR